MTEGSDDARPSKKGHVWILRSECWRRRSRHETDSVHLRLQPVGANSLRRAVLFSQLEKYDRSMTRRPTTIVLAIVVIAGSALLISHYTSAKSNASGAGTLTPTTTLTVSQARRYCAADGATITRAMTAFAAKNRGITVNETDLLSNSLGGPYLKGWSHQPDYVFSILGGILYLRSSMPDSKPIAFNGQGTCSAITL